MIAAAADADALLPPLTFSLHGKQIADQIFDNLADIGPSLNTVGDAGSLPPREQLALVSGFSSSFQHRPTREVARQYPGRSEDVRFTFGLVKDPALASPLAGQCRKRRFGVVPDSMTAGVWFHRRAPDEFFKAATPVVILPAHLLYKTTPAIARAQFAQLPSAPGDSGSAWVRGARIVLPADSANYRGRPKVDRAIWLVAAEYPAASLSFISGEADFLESSSQSRSLRWGEGRHDRVASGSLDYGYAAFNLRDASKGTKPTHIRRSEDRRALVMAVDRSAIVGTCLTRWDWWRTDRRRALSRPAIPRLAFRTTPRAVGTLDSLGWKRGADGLRSRQDAARSRSWFQV